MTSCVNKDVSIYQGIVLPLWMCWPFAPISHLMTWVENKAFPEHSVPGVWRAQAQPGLCLELISTSAASVEQLLPCPGLSTDLSPKVTLPELCKKHAYHWTKEASQRLAYICCRGGSGSIWPRNFGRRSKHIHKVDTALKAGDKRLFSIYLWSPAWYTAMFLVFGISTFGVMLSLLYLCSVNPNTGKSILKFNTVCSKNKLYNHRKGKKAPFKLANHDKLLHTPLSTPDFSLSPLFVSGTRFTINGSGDRNI